MRKREGDETLFITKGEKQKAGFGLKRTKRAFSRCTLHIVKRLTSERALLETSYFEVHHVIVTYIQAYNLLALFRSSVEIKIHTLFSFH